MDQLPAFMTSPLLIGLILFALGLSFGWKFLQAILHGELRYWAGLEPFGIFFAPITYLITPLLIHLPSGKDSLIKTKMGSSLVYLVYGPCFFLLSLVFLVAGADFMGLPGSRVMNAVLTLGQPNQVALEYKPPFEYNFPFFQKIRIEVVDIITQRLDLGKRGENDVVDTPEVKRQYRKMRRNMAGQDIEEYRAQQQKEKNVPKLPGL